MFRCDNLVFKLMVNSPTRKTLLTLSNVADKELKLLSISVILDGLSSCFPGESSSRKVNQLPRLFAAFLIL